MNSVDENTLPKEWKLVKFDDLFNITSSKRVHKKDWVSEGIPFYRTREIVKISKNGFIDNELFITEEMYNLFNEKFGAPQEDDILVTGVGTLGICYIVKPNDKFYFKDGNIIWFKKKVDVNSKFIEYGFKSEYIRKQVYSSGGSTVETYTIIRAKNTTIPLPPLEEQKRIVAKIDDLFAKIDKAISLTEESLKQAENLLPSVLKEVFEQLKCEHIPLSKFCSNPKTDMVGGPFGSNLKATEYVDEGFPIIRLQNVGRFNFIEKNIKFVTEEKAQFLKSHSYEYGDIVLTKLGDPLGKCCVVKNICGVDRGVISADIVRIRIDDQVNDKDFVVAGINSEVIKKQLVSKTQGTTRPRVTLKELREMSLPKPTFQEQVKIGNRISQYNEMSKVTQTTLKAQLAYLKQLKSSILSKAFKGEL